LNISVEAKILATALLIFICPRIVLAYPLRCFDGKEISSVEKIAISTAVKSSAKSMLDWPVLTFWLAYLSIVFGTIYAVISEPF
jgi:hypothetical protein